MHTLATTWVATLDLLWMILQRFTDQLEQQSNNLLLKEKFNDYYQNLEYAHKHRLRPMCPLWKKYLPMESF